MKTGFARAMVNVGLATGLLFCAVTASAVTINFDAETPSDELNDGSLESTPGTVEIGEVASYVSGGSGLTGIGTCWPSGAACDPNTLATVSPAVAASNIDHYWLQGDDDGGESPADGEILFVFSDPIIEVVAVSGIDHGPLPFEALEFIVWGCDMVEEEENGEEENGEEEYEGEELICDDEGAIKAVFDDGVDDDTGGPDLGGPGVNNPSGFSITAAESDDFSSVWTFENPHTYFLVTPGDHIAGIDSPGEYEIDGLAAKLIPAEECTEEGGCDLGGGVNVEFPPGTVLDPGATVSVSTIRVNGDGARCDLETPTPLSLFGGAVVLPPYLCGSPDFIVISTTLDGVGIFDGTVLVTNDTATVLPDNVYPDGEQSICEDPTILQDFPAKGDPQYQDVVGWQTTDSADMLETTAGGGGFALFDGTVGEFTRDCGGSSRGRVKKGSHYFIGLHVDFGPGFEWGTPGDSNTAGNFDKFVELTAYKLSLLAASVDKAKDNDALNNKDHRKLKKHVSQAIKDLGEGDYQAAHSHVKNFLNAVDKANYSFGTGENDNGEHIMRGGNCEFMLRVKIIPYAGL